MIKKITLVTALLFLQLLRLNAQVFIAYINPNFQQVNSKTFNAFANSYVAVNGQGLSSYNLQQTGTGLTIGLGINTRTKGVILGMEYSGAKSKTEFRFSNNARRYLSKHSNLLNFRIMVPVGDIDENRLLGLVEFGTGIGQAQIKSGFEQGNTPMSSVELDGNYKTIHTEISAGASLMYMLGVVGLKAGLTYNFTPYSTTLYDDNKALDFDSLPQDYSSFSYSPSTYSGEGVKSDFRYLKFGVGIVLLVH
jgi:hypothetical protein